MTRDLGGRGLDFPAAESVLFVSPRSNHQTVAQEIARIRSRAGAVKESTIYFYAESEEQARAQRLAAYMQAQTFRDANLFELADPPEAVELRDFESRSMAYEESLVGGSPALDTAVGQPYTADWVGTDQESRSAGHGAAPKVIGRTTTVDESGGGDLMKPHVSGITLGVEDVERAKRFYSQGLGWPVEMDAQGYVAFSINNGTAAFGLLSREALASANGVSPERSGFSGTLLSYVVSANDRVDEILAQVDAAGGTVVEPGREKWGSYGGTFTDPDGYLWNVAVGAGQPIAAE
jgi:predicted enzyme related to lactoylglutathione lyase